MFGMRLVLAAAMLSVVGVTASPVEIAGRQVTSAETLACVVLIQENKLQSWCAEWVDDLSTKKRFVL
jgi:hypothetical protein